MKSKLMYLPAFFLQDAKMRQLQSMLVELLSSVSGMSQMHINQKAMPSLVHHSQEWHADEKKSPFSARWTRPDLETAFQQTIAGTVLLICCALAPGEDKAVTGLTHCKKRLQSPE